MDFTTYYAPPQLYADHASAIDSGDWDLWPGFFTEDCSSRLQPRENHDRGFPLATLSFERKDMLRDRSAAARRPCSTPIPPAPHHRRVGVHALGSEHIHGEAHYAVLRTYPARIDGGRVYLALG